MTLDEDRARVINTVVRVCAAGHPPVTYYARRDQPEPLCPTCGRAHEPVKGDEHGTQNHR